MTNHITEFDVTTAIATLDHIDTLPSADPQARNLAVLRALNGALAPQYRLEPAPLARLLSSRGPSKGYLRSGKPQGTATERGAWAVLMSWANPHKFSGFSMLLAPDEERRAYEAWNELVMSLGSVYRRIYIAGLDKDRETLTAWGVW